jgi:GNAT superfamily N-acetyltransferase
MARKAPVTGLSVHQAVRADLPAVLDILADVTRWLHARGIDQWPPGLPSHSPELIGLHIDRGETYLVTGEHQAPIATIAMSDRGDPDLATTVSFGPTMTAPFGSTWRHRDGSMWPRFQAAPRRRDWSGPGPNQADMRLPMIRVGPLQGVQVGPTQAVLATDYWTTAELADPAAVYIHKAAVIRSHAGDGIGALMLRRVIDLAADVGARVARLDTSKTNPTIGDYYRRQGWTYLRTSAPHRRGGVLFQHAAEACAALPLLSPDT